MALIQVRPGRLQGVKAATQARPPRCAPSARWRGPGAAPACRWTPRGRDQHRIACWQRAVSSPTARRQRCSPSLVVRRPALQRSEPVRLWQPLALVQFIRDRIQANMEDPAERDRKWEQHLRGVQAAAASA